MTLGEALIALSSVALTCVVACNSSDAPANQGTVDAGTSSGSRASSSSSGSAPDADSGTTASAYAQALCAWNDRCDPVANLLEYGSLAACLSATDRYVALARTAPDTGITDQTLGACTAAANAAPCTQYPGLLGDCIFKGTRANGAACAFDEQCRLGRCLIAKGSTCGTCAAVGGLGEPCTEVPFCQTPLVCDATSKCAARAATGSPCTRRVGCASYGDRCVDGLCVRGFEKGATCSSSDTSSDPCGPGMLCVKGICTEMTVTLHAGQTCGDGIECLDGACLGDGPPYTCVAQQHEGEACGGTNMEICGEYRLQCLSGTCEFGPPPGACH